jgi:predicted RNA-binding Zn-ribbon protein involved in translation (DUF1610 family)
MRQHDLIAILIGTEAAEAHYAKVEASRDLSRAYGNDALVTSWENQQRGADFTYANGTEAAIAEAKRLRAAFAAFECPECGNDCSGECEAFASGKIRYA